MPEFRIEGDALKREARSLMLSRGTVTFLFAVSVLLFVFGILGLLRTHPYLGWLFPFTTVASVIGASILAIREARNHAERQMVFVLDENKIVRKRAGYPDVTIAFSEIKVLREELRWLIIRSIRPETKIGVPNSVQGYESIRAELAKHHPLSAAAKFPWTSVIWTPISILSWSLLLLSRDAKVVILAGAIALLSLAIASYYWWRSLHRGSNRLLSRKRLLLWLGLSSAWLTAVLLIYILVARR